MKKTYLKKIFGFFIIISTSTLCFAQTGPGGVGNADGSDSQPINVLWLTGNDVTQSSNVVSAWTDLSGNGNDLLVSANESSTGPDYVAGGVNGFDYLDFDDSNTSGEAGPDRMVINPFTDMPTSQISLFVMMRSSNSDEGIVSYEASGESNEWLLYNANSLAVYANSSNTNSSLDFSNGTTWNLISTTWQSSNGALFVYRDGGTSSFSGTLSSGTALTSGGSFVIGAEQDAVDGGYSTGQDLDGDIAEVILFGSVLNTAQRRIIENYLGAKYGVSINSDLYSGNDATYKYAIIGVGNDGGNTHYSAVSSSGLDLSASSLTSGQFVLAGHSNGSINASTADITGSVTNRWGRDWYVDVTGTGSQEVDLDFDFENGITSGLYPGDLSGYTLLYRSTTSGNYAEVSGVTFSFGGGQKLTATIAIDDLADGYYTLGTTDNTNSPIAGQASRTWYSYASGNWSDATKWTLDGSIAPLYNNEAAETPQPTDEVVITSGRTITMNVNNVSISNMEVIGTLDISTTSGHNFTNIEGSGKIKISGSSGTDNFPSGTTTEFADASDGGTLEINGTGFTLSTSRNVNNLIVNLTASSDTITFLSNWTANGDLTLQNGAMKINNNSATTNLSFTVYGDTDISANATLRVGRSNARHELNLYGNFTNNGIVHLTRRTSQTLTSEDTNGIIDANFLSDTEDQTITCNNTTRFYRIEINKGVDATYALYINASSSSNFQLYGYANENHAATSQLTSNANALGLIYGTVVIGTNVTISSLLNSGNYNVSAGAELRIDGGSVSIATNSLVPYGSIRLVSGNLSATGSSGITTRDNGNLIVEGGNATISIFRTSVLGSANQGGYYQSGGDVFISSSSTTSGYYAFSLTYEGNTFAMSAGTLRVRPNADGGIFINSDPENIFVTGGTIVCELNSSSNDFVMTSRAPFYNVTVQESSSVTSSFILDGGTSASGATDPRTLTAQPLVVYNDLYIDGSPATTFNANNVDITIGGSLTVENGATFTTGTNTLTFDQSGESLITLGNTTTTQTLNNLVIDKTTTFGGLSIISGASTALRIDGTFTQNNGEFDYKTFTIDLNGDVTLEDTIGTASSTGKLLFSGAALQTLTSSNSAIYNMELDNASGISLDGDLSIMGTLTLTNGVFDINTDKLRMEGASATITGTFSTTRMIQTDGNASDDGLEWYVNANETLTFPIGTNANSTTRYTPATMTIQNYSDDGYIKVNVADKELATTNASAGSNTVLTYYWHIDHSNFTTKPDLSSVILVASESDDIDGSDGNVSDDGTSLPSNWVPGKVENGEDSDDSSSGTYDRMESPGSISTYTISFTGNDTGNGVGSFTLTDANYTLGIAGRFTGSPQIFYYRSNGNWNNGTSWSFSDGGGSAGDYPQAGDIAIFTKSASSATITIPNGHQAQAALVKFDVNDRGGQGINVNSGYPRITINNNATAYTSILDVVEVAEDTHHGGNLTTGFHSCVIQFSMDNTYAGQFPSGDFNDFSQFENSLFIYNWTSGNGTVTLTTSLVEYPELWVQGGNGSRYLKMPDANVTVHGRFIIPNSMRVLVNDGSNNYLTVEKSLSVGHSSLGTGQFLFEGGGTNPSTVEVLGDITLNGGDTNTILGIDVNTAGAQTHKLIAHGNIIINTSSNQGGTINLGDGNSSNTNVELELQGESDNSFSILDASGSSATFYRIIMNKGTDTTYTFSLNDPFTLNGTTNSTEKAIELQNGTLILNESTQSITLTSGGGDFEIPAGSGLELTAGTAIVSGTDTGISLDGLLRVNGGTLNMDGGAGIDNFIEYSSSGEALLEITSGSLTIGSQVRRSLTATTGILKYRQRGGTVIIGKNAAPKTTRGVFEITNTGSEFDHTAGTLTIARSINSTTVPSILLEPETYDLSGSTITIGGSNLPSGTGSKNFGLKTNIHLMNLDIDNTSGNNPEVDIISNPLQIDGTLTLDANATLTAENYDVTLFGDFILNGTYDVNANTTYFSKTSGPQTLSGSGSYSFYNMTKNAAGTLVLSNNVTVNNDLLISSGILNQSTFDIDIKGDATIQSTVSVTGGNGLVFSGTSAQQLNGLTNTNVSLGILTLENSEGLTIPDGNGYNFTITSALNLAGGILDVGSSLLIIDKTADINEVVSYSVNNMIQTNSSFVDNGLRKIFDGSETSFVFPVGELKYTPARLENITSITTDGYITVRPANEIHPSVVEDSEAPDTEITDADNVLQYHWVVSSEDITDFDGTFTFTYDAGDTEVTAPYDLTNYAPARLVSGSTLWDKAYSSSDFNEGSNEFSFDLTNQTSAEIAGEYTAGVAKDGSDADINGAIPDEVPSYETNLTGTGNYSESANWTPLNGSPAVTEGVGPIGGSIIVKAGDVLTIDISNVRLLSTEIESGGTLIIDETTSGHRLGTVTGSGTIVLQNTGNLPAGFYDEFLSCSGGALEFAGTTNYDVLGGVSQIRKVVFSGTGTRTLPSNALDVCDSLEIDGPTIAFDNGNLLSVEDRFELKSGSFTLSNNSDMDIDGDFVVSGGTFTGANNCDLTIGDDITFSSGTLDFNTSDVTLDGNTTQFVSGAITFDNLTVNNSGSGIDLRQTGNVSKTVDGVLTFIDGLIYTGSGDTLIISSSGSYTGASANSFVSGPIRKNSISASSNYTFPVGKGSLYMPASIIDVGTGGQNWWAEYFESAQQSTWFFDETDPGSGYNALYVIYDDSWKIGSHGSNTAQVQLTYASHLGYSDEQYLRVTWWDESEATDRWENQGGIISGNATAGTVLSESVIHFSEQDLGLGSAPETLLPVELLYFKANIENDIAQLTWRTATETNNSHFIIEYSGSDLIFEEIGKVNGQGTTALLTDYQFSYSQLSIGINYFRLTQVDLDGKMTVFDPILVMYNPQQIKFEAKIYPNPVTNGQAFLQISTLDTKNELEIIITDLNGKLIERFTQSPETVLDNISLQNLQSLPSGIYNVVIRQKSQVIHQLMKIK